MAISFCTSLRGRIKQIETIAFDIFQEIIKSFKKRPKQSVQKEPEFILNHILVQLFYDKC